MAVAATVVVSLTLVDLRPMIKSDGIVCGVKLKGCWYVLFFVVCLLLVCLLLSLGNSFFTFVFLITEASSEIHLREYAALRKL